MNKFLILLKTELKLSFRGMDMIIFAICMPAVMIVILGVIYGNKPAFDGADYTFLEQSFGAVSAISICAGGVMGLPLLISDYRQKKILKRYKVTPSSPVLILSVHVAIYTIYSIISLLLNCIIAALLFNIRLRGNVLSFLVAFFIVMISIFSIGVLVGGVSKDMKTASILASVLYFPMLIFSGATLPYEVMPGAMQRIVDVFPLTQGIKLLKAASLGLAMENVMPSIMITIVIAVVCSGVSIRFFKWD